MIEKYIFLFTALLGFITLILIGFRYKAKRHINFYLILFFFLSSLRFFMLSLSDILPLQNFLKFIDLIYFITLWPLLYLYFSNLVKDHNALKIKELAHVVFLPLVFLFFIGIKQCFTSEAFVIGRKIIFILAIVWNIGYAIASYKLLQDKVWKRNSAILLINQQNKIIKQWTRLLFCLFILMFFRFLISIVLINSGFWYIAQNNFLWVGGIIWSGMYIKILYSPDFLYDYEEFQNKIREYKKHNIIFNNIWIMDTSMKVANIQDAVLKEKIFTNIENYVLEIENIAVNSDFFLSDILKIEDLAHKLKIPKSHVLYVFKYHASISFVGFKNLLRIQKTILLINDGYLNNNTIDSLAVKGGFSSYSPFFKSFKSITGMSPQEYCKDNSVSV